MAAEFEIIARYFAPIAGAAGLGLLDDAALVQPPAGHDLVITTDALCAGVHFFLDDPAETIGHKALGVNLSDLAAKGAKPLGFVLSLILPSDIQEEWIANFAKGIELLAANTDCPLIGGDTVYSNGPLSISITAFGSVPQGTMVKRGTAQAGDKLFVTGTIGDAALGLLQHSAKREGRSLQLSTDYSASLIERYLRPRPRNTVAPVLRDYARAAMDISDGFIGDLTKLVSLAGLGANVWLNDVPYSVAARAAFRADAGLIETALTGGDDYELLAAVPSQHAKAFIAGCLKFGVTATQVGEITEACQSIRFLESDGKQRHFSSPSYVHGDG
jgi:thiamine-monophosphate kinase